MHRSTATIFFYCRHGKAAIPGETSLDPLYTSRLWTPKRGGIVPLGLPLWPYGVWTAMHHLRVFYGREYGVFLIYHRDRLVHRSCLFPRYQRFPFMATNDLQIGDVWTDPAHQNRGLASFAIEQILYAKAKPGRALWYVVDAGNFPSIRMVENLGFLRVGVGRRSRRLGLSLLGQFLLEQSEASEERGDKAHI